ncbi:hypothetical protein ABZ671_17620 [Micromonospora sp. NPDC006766]|uniref:hypothetical protein n=1 Tax=Micromonospora sp. NPDC006766 TaxID=3154778 RepID=UPI00340267DC
MYFVDRVSASDEIDEERRAFVDAHRPAELDAIIVDENSEPRSDQDPHRPRIPQRRRPTAGTKILPPASCFSAAGGHGEQQQRVLTRRGVFFERFFGLNTGDAE